MVIIALLLVFVSSCASWSDHLREVSDLYASGRYELALQKLQSSSVKQQSRNRLLYHLELAMLYDRLNRHQKSRREFFRAAKLAEDLYTTSVSREAASYLFSSDATEYSGEDYEKIFIHTMLALSYLSTDELQEALVEARRINLRLHAINRGYGDAQNRYNEDALARYLAGMIHEANGNVDSAFIDYHKAWQLYRDEFKIFNNQRVPRQVGVALYRLSRRAKRTLAPKLLPKLTAAERQQQKNQAEVAVIHQFGRIANKEAREFLFPLERQVVRFSFPVVVARHSRYGRSGVTLRQRGRTARFIASEQMINLDQVAQVALEDRRARLTVKQITRLVSKGVLTDQMHRKFGTLAGVAFNVYAAATETADTRSWSLLPARIAITRFAIPAKQALDMAIINNGVTVAMHRLRLKRGALKLYVSKGV